MNKNKFELKKTYKYGDGMFATADIKKGETIYHFNGKIFTLDEIMDEVNAGRENIDDPLQVESESFLVLNDISRSFNHSCDPNAGMRGKSELFAIREIKKGEEIVYDYSSVVGPNITSSMWTMSCNCGSKKCRKIIGNVLSIPKKDLQKYFKAGAFQDYIKKQLKNKIR